MLSITSDKLFTLPYFFKYNDVIGSTFSNYLEISLKSLQIRLLLQVENTTFNHVLYIQPL